MLAAVAIVGGSIVEARTLQPADLGRLEHVRGAWPDSVASAPDGEWAALVICRGMSTASDVLYEMLDGLDRGDIVLVNMKTGAVDWVTDGTAAGTGYFAPRWSPDGRSLLMLGVTDGFIYPYVWHRASRALERLVDRSIAAIGQHRWISNTEVMLPLLGHGARTERATFPLASTEVTMRAWPAARTGRAVTASALDSRFPESVRQFHETTGSALVRVRIDSRRIETVAQGEFSEVWLSPDRRKVAAVRKTGFFMPNLVQPATQWSLEKFELLAGPVTGALVAIEVPGSTSVALRSVRWSPDGRSLVFFAVNALRDGLLLGVTDLGRAVPQTKEVIVGEYRLAPGLDPLRPLHAPTWVSVGELRLQALPIAATSTKTRSIQGPLVSSSRADSNPSDSTWLRVDLVRGRVAADAMAPVTRIWRGGRRGELLGVGKGRLWTYGANGPWKTAAAPLTFDSLLWPADDSSDADRLVALSGEWDGAQSLHFINIATGEVDTHAIPALARVRVEALSGTSGAAIVSLHQPDGVKLRLLQAAGEGGRDVHEINGFLREVTPGEPLRVNYRGLDGQPLSAWLLMPPGHEVRRRYPLVVWVYPGHVAGPSPDPLMDIGWSDALNLQLLAAQGYAVLSPSMPRNAIASGGDQSARMPDDPYFALLNGVLPAIDAAAETGHVDVDRVSVMGHSYGGYGVYGLITQTQRFRCAVAMNGPSNLLSNYGTFDARMRYADDVHWRGLSGFVGWSELGQGRMLVPPSRDLQRYVRNSPVSYVDRVETPLMIVHSDLDFVPITQAEEFFTGLLRQGKRAQFVRYWGEGHVIQGGANVNDMWNRILA